MTTLLMGLGRQGYRMLELAMGQGMAPVTIVDSDPKTVARALEQFGSRVCVPKENPLGLSDEKRADMLAEFDLVLDALPSFHSFELIKSCIQAGTTVVSVSFLEEDFMALDADARANQALVIPDCGGAPGFSHMMAGYSVRKLGGAQRVIMKVGAIPQNPEPPFFHSLTWSVEDLMEEYFRPAKCRHHGAIAAPDPFADVKEEQIQGMQLQSFLSDGARSFLQTYPDVPFMEERTLRHHGHLKFMSAMGDAGFLTREAVMVDRDKVVPYRFLAAMLEQRFGNLPPEDHFIMQVEVEGPGGRHLHDYNMPYDAVSNVFGLVNSVAVTAMEAAAMVLDGTIQQTGVLPLELLSDEEPFRRMSEAHRQLGALVELQIDR